MTRRIAFGFIVLLVAAGVARAGGFEGPTIAHPVRVPDFALRDQYGRIVRLSAQRGSVVLLTFLYTHCLDLCPLTAVALDKAANGFQNVRVIAVSVDPRDDTPAAVRRFVKVRRLHAEFRYLTGSTAALRRIWATYHVTSRVKAGDALVDHTLYTMLIDKQGRDRVLYGASAPPSEIAHDIRVLLG